MNIHELKIGTKLEIDLVNEDGIKLEYSLASEFEWLISDQTAVIAAPIHEGEIIPIRHGVQLYIYFRNYTEGDIELYRFKARVTGRDRTDNIALLKINIEGEIERIQRRRFYRLKCSLQVKYKLVDTMDRDRNEQIPFRSTVSCDLSGGGIRLLLEEKIEPGKLIECEITTNDEKTIVFYGRVIRYEDRDIESKFRYEAGVAYIKIDERDRESVVKYVFDQQRILRKKGMI